MGHSENAEDAGASVGAVLLVALATAPETASKFESWIGEAVNEPISGEEIAAHLAPEALSALAEKAGVSEAEVAARLAEEIPLVADTLPSSTILEFQEAQSESSDAKAVTAHLEQAEILERGLSVVNRDPAHLAEMHRHQDALIHRFAHPGPF